MTTYTETWIREEDVLSAYDAMGFYLDSASDLPAVTAYAFWREEVAAVPGILLSQGDFLKFFYVDTSGTLQEAILDVVRDEVSGVWRDAEETGPDEMYLWIGPTPVRFNPGVPEELVFTEDVPSLVEISAAPPLTEIADQTYECTLSELTLVSQDALVEVPGIPPLTEISGIPPLAEVVARESGERGEWIYDGDNGEPKWRCQCDACSEPSEF